MLIDESYVTDYCHPMIQHLKAKVAHILLFQSPRNLIEKDVKWFGRKSGLWYQVYGLDVKATSATV